MKFIISLIAIITANICGASCPTDGKDWPTPSSDLIEFYNNKAADSDFFSYEDAYKHALVIAKKISNIKLLEGVDSNGNKCSLEVLSTRACHPYLSKAGAAMYDKKNLAQLVDMNVKTNFSNEKFNNFDFSPSENEYSVQSTKSIYGFPLGPNYYLNVKTNLNEKPISFSFEKALPFNRPSEKAIICNLK